MLSVPSRAVRAALGLPPRRPNAWTSCAPTLLQPSTTPATRHFVKPSLAARRAGRQTQPRDLNQAPRPVAEDLNPAAKGWATTQPRSAAARDADSLFSAQTSRSERTPRYGPADDSGSRDGPRRTAWARDKGRSMDVWISKRSGAAREGRSSNNAGDRQRARARRDFGGPGSSKKKPAYLPPRKVEFGLPEPPRPRKLLRDLRDQCFIVGEGTDTRKRVIVYGVAGEAVRQMAKAGSDEEAVAVLLDEWKVKAVAEIDELLQATGAPVKDARGSQTLHPPLRNKKGGLLDVEGALQAQRGPDAERSLRRYAMQSFLDWIETRLKAQGSRKDAASSLALIQQLRATVDLSMPSHAYADARTLTRHIHLHVGPTNSGKTHGALVALCKARTGVYAGPLRLLAHEVWERINEGTVSPGVAPRACNLLTGEEKRVVDPLAGLQSCTVEMASMDQPVDVAVVDEIQMISDEQRGYAWTAAVLGLPAKEIHLCGEASAVPLVERLAASCGDVLTVHEYKRLTPLAIEDESLDNDLSRIRKGDCVVAFSRGGIFGLKNKIEKATGLKCAVAYGSLPPETKSEQARLFNDPDNDLDVMVASDAIGMGLNLKIKRVIFHSVTKWNGSENVYLSASQIKQIAGRAGRYGTGAEAGGTCTTLMPDDLPVLKAALEAPVVPIEQAAIQPASEAIASLSSLLGEPASQSEEEAESNSTRNGVAMDIITRPQRSLSSLYTDVGHLARVDSRAFFLSGFSQQHVLSPLIEEAGAGRLTLADRERFSNAPANTRDEVVVRSLQNMVNDFAGGRLVKFSQAVEELGLLEALQMVEGHSRKARVLAEREMKRRRGEGRRMGKGEREAVEFFGRIEAEKREKQGAVVEDEAGEASTEVKAASDDEAELSSLQISHLTPEAYEALDINVLMQLESLHRCLSLYLWLSFRFPLNFCFQDEVEGIKARAEVAIPFVLEAIRAGRRARLQSLNEERERRARRA